MDIDSFHDEPDDLRAAMGYRFASKLRCGASGFYRTRGSRADDRMHESEDE